MRVGGACVCVSEEHEEGVCVLCVIFESTQKLGFATMRRVFRGEGTGMLFVCVDRAYHAPGVVAVIMHVDTLLSMGSLRGDTSIEGNRKPDIHQHPLVPR